MSDPQPHVSVVASTFNRAERLERLLTALRAQTLDASAFEVIVVDDVSTDATREVLEREVARGDLRLRPVYRNARAGPATAREQGWRAATAELIAFTDDDCEPEPDWLAAGLKAWKSHPGAFVQGRTEPNPRERNRLGPFTRTIEVAALDPNFHTCNIFYPRALLERLEGFDTASFDRSPGGEDSDLAWRAIAAGARPVFAADAPVFHAVNELGPFGKLRVAARWTTPMKTYVLHPELRRQAFAYGIFWKREHYWLLRAIVGSVLPTRWGWLRSWLLSPYLRSVYGRAKVEGGGLALAPYYVAHDLVETWAVARAAVRYRTPML